MKNVWKKKIGFLTNVWKHNIMEELLLPKLYSKVNWVRCHGVQTFALIMSEKSTPRIGGVGWVFWVGHDQLLIAKEPCLLVYILMEKNLAPCENLGQAFCSTQTLHEKPNSWRHNFLKVLPHRLFWKQRPLDFGLYCEGGEEDLWTFLHFIGQYCSPLKVWLSMNWP